MERQLRLTPLSPRTYFRAKVLTTYALCLTSIAVLFVVGLLLGAHMTPWRTCSRRSG